MALRDQPYFPLYIQDYLTDEKLNECSAATQGIYIKIMCLMHKSDTYGKIMLKQKYKQDESYALSFGLQFAKHLPFNEPELVKAITELLNEKVCYIEDEYICQKRMIHDNDISIKRAEAGKKGGNKSQENNKKFAKAKHKANSEANTEYENEYEIDSVIKKEEVFNFRENLIGLGIEKQIIDDWLKVRKSKKASNTETAFNAIKNQIELSGLIANECIKISVENSWAGFKKDWLDDKNHILPQNKQVNSGVIIKKPQTFEGYKS